jgi:hypothetical protein
VAQARSMPVADVLKEYGHCGDPLPGDEDGFDNLECNQQVARSGVVPLSRSLSVSRPGCHPIQLALRAPVVQLGCQTLTMSP